MKMSGGPVVIFQCGPNSYTFEQRTVSLNINGTPTKIGRSQGPLKPRNDNAIFECRVLSRNHAQIWFNPTDDHFYLKDMGSSNGTFVNGQKINDKEKQLKSGDVLQFGVDVDNNPRQTYSCVVSQVRCVHADGSENQSENNHVSIDSYTKANSNSSAPTPQQNGTSKREHTRGGAPPEEIDDRSHVGKLKADLVEFGSHTENIENKMVTIQRVIDEISNMQEEQWNERLNEDILLTKIENLERKVKDDDLTDETLRYRNLCDEMAELDQTSKKALRQSLQEKLLVQQQCDDLKAELNLSEEENEKVLREVRTLQDLIKDKNKAIGILEKTSEELEKRQKPQFEEIFDQVLQEVKCKNINEDQFKALKALILDGTEELDNSMSDFMAHEEMLIKIGQKEKELELMEKECQQFKSQLKEKCEEMEAERKNHENEKLKAQEDIDAKIELLTFKENEMDSLNKERMELVNKINQLHIENKSICDDLLNQTTADQNYLLESNETKQKIIYVLVGFLVLLIGIVLAK